MFERETRKAIEEKVAISLDEEHPLHATLRPVRSATDMTFGAIRPRKRPEDFEELRELFMEDAQERDERTKRTR